MIRAVEWFIGLGALFGLWGALLTGTIFPSLVNKHEVFVLSLPIISLGLFGIFSILFIYNKAVNIKDCSEASDELKSEIEEAKVDLKKRGITLDH